MTDQLATAVATLASLRHAHASRTVTYRRAAASCVVNATKGRTRAETHDAGGYAYEYATVDWIVRPEDLILDGQTITPAAGDEIIEPTDSESVTYTVVESDALPAFERIHDGRGLRIHVQETARTPRS